MAAGRPVKADFLVANQVDQHGVSSVAFSVVSVGGLGPAEHVTHARWNWGPTRNPRRLRDTYAGFGTWNACADARGPFGGLIAL